MARSPIETFAAPFKRVLPRFIWAPARRLATGLFTPVAFSLWSGHFKSSLKERAVSAKGDALPWYSYPAIQFLAQRDFKDKTVLEFGGGQSTLWWAERAKSVVTFEGDPDWQADLAKRIPPNVTLYLAPAGTPAACVAFIDGKLQALGAAKFDVIVIDSLCRRELVRWSLDRLALDGALICDNAEGYGFQEESRDLAVSRVDFFGHAPGVILPHATSVFFRGTSFVFDARHPLPDIAKQR